MDSEKEAKRLEMIGELFVALHIETAALIMKEYSISKPEKIAIEVEEIFPKTFARLADAIQDEFDDWCDQYDAKCDPPMDKFDYLRQQI